MASKITNSQLKEIISLLANTTESIDGVVLEVTGNAQLSAADLTEDQLNEIDKAIFLCDECEWWCLNVQKAPDEDSIGKICNDCLNVM